MRNSSLSVGRGIFGKLLPKVPKSSMRNSNLVCGVGWGILCQENPILCDFHQICVTLDLTLASQIITISEKTYDDS